MPRWYMSPDKTTFIYALKDPRDGSVRYIGKADDPDQRLSVHCSTNERDGGKKRVQWILDLRADGLEPEMEVLEETTYDRYQRRESYWIYHFSKKGEPLTNQHAFLHSKPVSVAIRGDQAKAIKAIAKEEGTTFTVVTRALIDYAMDNMPDDLMGYAMGKMLAREVDKQEV